MGEGQGPTAEGHVVREETATQSALENNMYHQT